MTIGRLTTRSGAQALFLMTTLALAATVSCGTESASDQPPTVVVGGAPADGTFLVGDTLNITIQAQDPEGGSLTFDWDHKPKEASWTVGQRSEFLTFENEAVFTWDPLASDALNTEPIQLIFIVTDSSGSVTEKVVTIQILPGNGRPVFKSSASELFDPRRQEKVEFEVTVTDQDSSAVELTLDQATKPPGSEFNQTGEYTGIFSWTPTPEQLERKVYTANFLANDMQNAPEPFRVTIVIRSATAVVIDKDQTMQMCPAAAVIDHTPIGSQRDPVNPYRIEARIVDPAYDRAVVYVSSKLPYNGEQEEEPEDPAMAERQGDEVEMVDEGGLLVAEISPYTGFIGDSGALTLYYQICAFDDEGVGEAAISCTPSSGDIELWHSFTAYTPDAPPCVDDGLDLLTGNDDFGTAVELNDKWENFRVCANNPDYFVVTLRDGESALFSALYNTGSNIAFEAYDPQQQPVEVKASNCTGLVTAEVDAPPGGGSFYFKATGDDTNYVLRAFKTGNAAECSDIASEPNEDASSPTPTTDGATVNAEICPDGSDQDVYSIDLNGGDVLTVTHTFDSAAGNLDMTLFSPGQDIDRGGLGTGAYTAGFESPEVLMYTAEASGSYNLLVFNNNESSVAYQLDFSVMAAPPCTDTDSAGRSKADALIIPAESEVTLNHQVCPGAADWMQRTEFGPVLGELTVTGGDGTIDDVTVTIYDQNDQVVGAGVLNGNVIDVELFPAGAGQYYYEVSTTARVEYQLYLVR